MKYRDLPFSHHAVSLINGKPEVCSFAEIINVPKLQKKKQKNSCLLLKEMINRTKKPSTE